MKDKQAKIYYYRFPTMPNKEAKLELIQSTNFQDIPFERITPDEKGNWINQTDNDFDTLMPLCSKEVKSRKGKTEAIFELFSLGVVTARDAWVYDFDKNNVSKKVNFLIDKYNQEAGRLKGIKKEDVKDEVEYSIKWTRAVKNDLAKGKLYAFDESKIIESLYRPFVKKQLYFSKELNEMRYQMPVIFGNIHEHKNKVIFFTDSGSQREFMAFTSNKITDYHSVGNAAAANCLPLYRYENGERKENITDWALAEFRRFYATLPTVADLANRTNTETQPLSKSATIDKVSIFHYVYAVLHNPQYRQKYEQNLKRDFPRIPLYEDFWQWADWGKKLMDLHLNYETIESYELEVMSDELKNANATPKPKLKANKELGEIYIDEATTLKGIPSEAWAYKLGNRSALEWVLDQYKESKPTDPTIAEKFNTYRFADYKTQVIDLLQKVCTVSVETIKIVREMEGVT